MSSAFSRIRSHLARAALSLCALLPAMGTAQTAAAPGAMPDVGPVEVVKRDNGLPATWRQGPFMEVLVRAYQDSNGDGIGDLNGLTSRLDYLKDLGITGLWLMPIFKSEDRDHGYAVVNYREIEPDYGTLADFDRLLAEAHKRGIGVIVDYVINHSAASHPAFESAYDSRKSPYADWYIFQEERPAGWNTFSGDPWREGNQRWYYAVFDQQMPDFNLRNPAVVDFHLSNLKFWLNRGVDGFRFDAVGVLIENRAIAWENQPENHQLMKRVQDLVASYGNRFMVCEAPSDPGAFAAADSCGKSFAFGLQKHIVGNVKIGRVRDDMLSFLRKQPVARMGTILSNHDHFAGNRLAKQFANDEKSYRMAVAALLTLPGTPFLYYGEEIGLSHSEPVAYTDQSLRGPMSWSADRNAGFTTADKPFRPLVGNWKTNNVQAQQADASSLYHWYRQLIALRRAEPALAQGELKLISERDAPVLAFTRDYEGSRVLVLLNLAYREVTYPLSGDFQPAQWKPLFPTGAAATWVSDPKQKDKAPAIKMQPQQVLLLKAAS